MKKLSKLKLNQVSKAELRKRELSNIRGGIDVLCVCFQDPTYGGSLGADNLAANYYEAENSYYAPVEDVTCAFSGDEHYFASF